MSGVMYQPRRKPSRLNRHGATSMIPWCLLRVAFRVDPGLLTNPRIPTVGRFVTATVRLTGDEVRVCCASCGVRAMMPNPELKHLTMATLVLPMAHAPRTLRTQTRRGERTLYNSHDPTIPVRWVGQVRFESGA